MIARSPVLWYFEKCFHFIYGSRHTKASTALCVAAVARDAPALDSNVCKINRTTLCSRIITIIIESIVHSSLAGPEIVVHGVVLSILRPWDDYV